jgi:hypothetical protein
VNFVAVDPSGQYETGDIVPWSNKLVLRNRLEERDGKRSIELLVAPKGNIRYTVDGSEPREGTPYEKALDIGNGEILLRVFAEAGGLEAKTEFRFPARGKKGVQIDPAKPGRIVGRTGHKLDSRAKTFESLKIAGESGVNFENVHISVGQGAQIIQIMVGEVQVDSAFLEAIFKPVLEKFPPTTPVTMTFRKACFQSGHDLKEFAERLGIELQAGDVEQ